MRVVDFAVGLTLMGAASPAFADITHVVQPGHTLEAIAHRYHVRQQSILEANHLKDGQHLKPGQTLIIPGVSPPTKADASGDNWGSGTGGRRHATSEHHEIATANPVQKPRGRGAHGIIEVVRMGQEARVRVKDGAGHVPSAALGVFEHVMRQGESTHPPDPRLVALMGIVSEHFGGRPIQVVSGYRAYSPTQYAPHSNHNYGKALDFRIEETDNKSIYDFCVTLRNTGCGYYPNSTFVHMDVRDAKARWIDRSRPGEPPLYDKAGTGAADEGRSEVPEEKAAPPRSPKDEFDEKSTDHGSPIPHPHVPPFDSEVSL
jgi:uncharacterized protein YcbK (DUF882 family)